MELPDYNWCSVCQHKKKCDIINETVTFCTTWQPDNSRSEPEQKILKKEANGD